MTSFGTYIRNAREKKQAEEGGAYSLRQVAGRVGVAPAYLSQVERDEGSPRSQGGSGFPLFGRVAAALRGSRQLLVS